MEIIEYINIGLIFTGVALIAAELLLGIDSLLDLVLSGLSLFIGGMFGLGFNNSWEVGMIFSLILLGFYWFLGRTLLHNKLQTPEHRTNVDRLVGMKIKITKADSDKDIFQVRVEGEVWSAKSDIDFKVGDMVEIVAVNGSMLEIKSIS